MIGGSRVTRDPTPSKALLTVRHFLFQLQLRRPCATLHDLEIALDHFGAEFVGMRTVAAAGEHAVFVHGVVELGMVRQ